MGIGNNLASENVSLATLIEERGKQINQVEALAEVADTEMLDKIQDDANTVSGPLISESVTTSASTKASKLEVSEATSETNVDLDLDKLA